jgi:UDP-arabinose 4-epimerase
MCSLKVLITGGAGYVGSHCAKQFHDAGWLVVVYDNLSRGWRDFIRWGVHVQGDILDEVHLRSVLYEHQPDLVVHFAALAYVAESVACPENYFRTNTVGSLNVLSAMRDAGVRSLVFSSTCATYGMPASDCISEGDSQHPINPYGWSKLFVERMIESFGSAYGLRYVSLRYFNAAGADLVAEIGERHEPETHVIPLALRGLFDNSFEFVVNGIDYQTRDGSCERDYIHVIDLARAHLKAAQYLWRGGESRAFNLGTGRGVTVLELIRTIESVAGRSIRWRAGPRREGDPPILVADNTLAKQYLDFNPQYSSIERIVSDAWQWMNAEMLSGG